MTSRSFSLAAIVRDLLVLDHARQAVRAEQVDVAQLAASSTCMSTFTVSFMPSARTITFLCGKFAISSGREVLHLDVVVEQRVVLGQLLELAVADAVERGCRRRAR